MDKLTKDKLDKLFPSWYTSYNANKTKELLEAVDISYLHTKAVRNFILDQQAKIKSKDINVAAGTIIRSQMFLDRTSGTTQVSDFLGLKEENFKNNTLLGEDKKIIKNLTYSSSLHSFILLDKILENGYCETIISTIVSCRSENKSLKLSDITDNILDLETKYNDHSRHMGKEKVIIAVENMLNEEVNFTFTEPEEAITITTKNVITRHFKYDNSKVLGTTDNASKTILTVGDNMYKYSDSVPTLYQLNEGRYKIGASKQKFVYFDMESQTLYIKKCSKVDFQVYKYLAEEIPEMKAELSLYLHFVRDIESYKIATALGIVPSNFYYELWNLIEVNFSSTIPASIEAIVEYLASEVYRKLNDIRKTELKL